MTLAEVARELDVSPDTPRRWARQGLVPLPQGRWTPAALAHARIVARLLDGFTEDLFPSRAETHTLEEAAELTGLEPALVERIWTAVGFAAPSGDEVMIVVDAGGAHLGFERIGEVKLKGFSESTELFLARQA